MSIDKIKKLRELSSLGISDCKKALAESGGDFDKALKVLKKKGIELIEKKKSRAVSSGLIESYVHFGGNLGSLVEINCETDFVAKTDVFKQFAKDLAMHVAAASPKYLAKDQVPKDELKGIKDLEEFAKENCLLEQLYIKDNSKSIKDYLKEVVSQLGENIIIKRFARFSLGDNEG